MKALKRDPQTGDIDKDNPFGAVIKQGGQSGPKSKGKVSSRNEPLREEGDWDNGRESVESGALQAEA